VNNWSWDNYVRALLACVGGGVPGGVWAIVRNPVVGLLATVGGFFLVFVYILWQQQLTFRRFWAEREELVYSFREFIRDLESHPVIKQVTLTYEVGLTARHDKRRREYVIKAETDEVLYVKELRFGAAGKKVPNYQTLSQLGVEVEVDQGKVYIVPTYEDDPGKIKAHVRFRPRIGTGEERRLRILSRWAGDWNDLRATGQDRNCGYETNLSIEDLCIVVLMPPGIHEREFTIERSSKFDSVGTLASNTDRATGRLYTVWHISNPSQDEYEYIVTCKSLRKVSKRLWLRMMVLWKQAVVTYRVIVGVSKRLLVRVIVHCKEPYPR